MNIQIFGKNKCFDTKKAQRWFKERGIKFQMIDLAQKGMSKGELDSVLKAVGGLDNLLDQKSKSYASLAFLAYDEDQEGKAARGRHADENANCPQRPSGNCRLPARCLGAVGITSPKPFYASERLFPCPLSALAPCIKYFQENAVISQNIPSFCICCLINYVR